MRTGDKASDPDTGTTRDLNYGSRVLPRPVQRFGRLISIESVDLPPWHDRRNYATSPDVPAVFATVPIDPRAVPSRTLITSSRRHYLLSYQIRLHSSSGAKNTWKMDDG